MPWFGLILMAASTAWGQNWNVFLPDDRALLPADKVPALFLGVVEGQQRCTGTLVGRRLVLTAAHCLRFVGPHLDSSRPATFSAGLRGGISAASNLPTVVAGLAGRFRTETDPRSEDWAVLVLSEAPMPKAGGAFGWLDTSLAPPVEGMKISLAGYSWDFLGGKSPSVHWRCGVRETFPDGHFYHDCDGNAGASGGPILAAGPTLVGITNSHFSDSTRGDTLPGYQRKRANVGTGALNFSWAILRLRSLYP